jgi:hypothetical protein
MSEVHRRAIYTKRQNSVRRHKNGVGRHENGVGRQKLKSFNFFHPTKFVSSDFAFRVNNSYVKHAYPLHATTRQCGNGAQKKMKK